MRPRALGWPARAGDLPAADCLIANAPSVRALGWPARAGDLRAADCLIANAPSVRSFHPLARSVLARDELRWVLGPRVARVPPHELLAQGRVVLDPEARQVGGDLDGPLVGRQQVQ